jgi:hypothetical protein
LSQAAVEAIERAAGLAAKAAALASVEREAVALREAQRWRLEAELRQQAVKDTRNAGIKNAVIAGAVCLFGGIVVGVGGTLLMSN